MNTMICMNIVCMYVDMDIGGDWSSSTEKIHYFLQIYILVETHLNLSLINYT